MINEQIRDKEVRLIGAEGEQLGIMSAREAQKPVSYTHLDVYKRQLPRCIIPFGVEATVDVEKQKICFYAE